MTQDSPSPPASHKKAGLWMSFFKFSGLVVLLLLSAYAYHLVDQAGYHGIKDAPAAAAALRHWAQHSSLLGVLLLWLGGAMAILINIPAAFVVVLAAAMYGALAAVPLGMLALNTATVPIYFLGQYLGRDFVQQIFGRMLQRLERQMHHRSMMAVIHMRLLFFALPPVNWFLAVIQIGFRDYWLGTLLGSLPKIALFAWVGGAIFGPLAKGHILHWYAPQFWLPPVAGVVLSLVLRYVDKTFLAKRV